MKDIKALKDEIVEMQETNNFLSKQIDNLNDQIYDLNNVENNENVSERRTAASPLKENFKNKLIMSSNDEETPPTSSKPLKTILDANKSELMTPSSKRTAQATGTPSRCAQQ